MPWGDGLVRHCGLGAMVSCRCKEIDVFVCFLVGGGLQSVVPDRDHHDAEVMSMMREELPYDELHLTGEVDVAVELPQGSHCEPHAVIK